MDFHLQLIAPYCRITHTRFQLQRIAERVQPRQMCAACVKVFLLTLVVSCAGAGSLLPGSLVNARVRNVLSDGLLLSFLTYFNGTIDSFHLAQVWQAS